MRGSRSKVWVAAFLAPASALTADILLFRESLEEPGLPDTLEYAVESAWRVEDGRLVTAGDGMATSKAAFAVAPDLDLVYSVDMGKPDGVDPVLPTVLTLGNYWVVVHPGWTSPRGAFRLERVEGDGSRTELISNQDMGFIPAAGEMHHVDALLSEEDDGLRIEVRVNGNDADGVEHTYDFSYLDTAPGLGDGRIGVGSGYEAFFDNLEVRSRGRQPFTRGDANADGFLDVSDAVFILLRLFIDARPADCLDAHDVDDDGRVNVSDPIGLLEFLFRNGSSPSEPFLGCGDDPSQDDLECDDFGRCGAN